MLLGVLCLLAGHGAASAQVTASDFYFIPDGSNFAGIAPRFAFVIGFTGFDQTFVNDPTASDYEVVGLASGDATDGLFVGPQAETVTISKSGELFSNYAFMFNKSTLNVSNGKIDGELDCFDSDLNVSGTGIVNSANPHGGSVTIKDAGTITSLGAQEGSLVTLNGSQAAIGSAATAQGGLTLYSGADLEMIDGSVFMITADGDKSAANLYKGNVTGTATANNGGTINVTGIDVDLSHDLVATGTSSTATVSLTDGKVEGNVLSSDAFGMANISGGTVIGDVTSYGGTVNMTGGNVLGNVSGSQSGKITISAGTVGTNVIAADKSIVNLSGNVTVAGVINAQTGGEINMSGGTVSGNAATYDDAVMFIGNGTVSQSAFSYGTSLLYVTNNGHVLGDVLADDDSTATVSGGHVDGELLSAHGAVLSMTGGTVGALATHNVSALTMTFGTVLGNATSYDASQMELRGGLIEGDVDATNGSTIHLNGTFVLGTISAHNQGSLVIGNGGTQPPSGTSPMITLPVGADSPGGDAAVLTDQWAANPASAPSQIYLYDNSTLEIDGLQFSASLIDPNSGGLFSEYGISGLFADGSAFGNGAGFDLFVQNGTSAAYQFVQVPPVPEPTSLALIGGFPVVFFLGLRRR